MGWWGQHSMGAMGLVYEAHRAINLAELGIGAPTALTDALLEFYGRADLAELNQWLTRRHDRATQAQRLAAAHVVPAVATAGDAVAQGIVDEQGRRTFGVAARALERGALSARPLLAVSRP